MNTAYLIQCRRELIDHVRALAAVGTDREQAVANARTYLLAHGWLDPKPLAPLTDREQDQLRELKGWSGVDEDWARPMDVGGRDGSDHSRVLMRLVAKGYARMKRHGGAWRYAIR